MWCGPVGPVLARWWADRDEAGALTVAELQIRAQRLLEPQAHPVPYERFPPATLTDMPAVHVPFHQPRGKHHVR